jgi:chitodextrinase
MAAGVAADIATVTEQKKFAHRCGNHFAFSYLVLDTGALRGDRLTKIMKTKAIGWRRAMQVAIVLAIAFGFQTAFAAKKGGGGSGDGGATTAKPPTPTNFRVTAKTAYSITVSWDVASSTADFNFYLSGTSRAQAVVLPKTARTHTFERLAPGNEYWLFIYAKDAAGNVSGQANLGPVKTLLDTTPPWTAPVVSIGEVGANYAHISWTRAADDGPYHYSYELWLNGNFYYSSFYPRDTVATVLRLLQPDTDYTVQIRTTDYGGNASPLSAPVAFRTTPVNPDDVTPPTVPGDVFAYGGFGGTEMELWYSESTDDFDHQDNIRYDVYVNGRLEDYVFGVGGPRVIYGDLGENVIEVFATDTAGNRSEPAVVTVFIDP